MRNWTIPIAVLVGVLWMSSCTGASFPATPVRSETPTAVPTDVFEVPLANPHKTAGCDFGDKPCASGRNGEPAGYHTGFDYGQGGEVLASGPGIVVLKQINGQQDHGVGNVVILKHFRPDGRLPVYTLYAHLASISGDLEENRCVDLGHPLGRMGGSGYGQPDYWSVHLHFEFKISAVLGDPKTPDKYWGYIPQTQPDALLEYWGYVNPNDYIGKETVLRCEALTSELPSTPSPSPTATRTPVPPSPTLRPTLTRTTTATPPPTSTRRPTATPTSSAPPGYWIAYVDLNENVRLIHPDGSGLRQLTFDGQPGSGPSNPGVTYRNLRWSPDGSLLGMTRIDANGSRIQTIQMSDLKVVALISNTEGSFDWLPDGQSIIYSSVPYESSSNRGNQPGGLSLLEIGTGKITSFINSGPDERLVRPDWAPRGDSVYFSIEPAPNPDVIWGDQLGLAKADGGSYVTVANIAWCDWSPNGQRLACIAGSGEILCSSIVIFSSSGEHLASIPAVEGCHQFGQPAWSPDGQWLAFENDLFAGPPGMSVMRADGSQLTDLSRKLAFAMAPAWSPKGNTLAFLAGTSWNQDIYTVNVDGTQWKMVTNSVAGVQSFAWQPGGSSGSTALPALVTPTGMPLEPVLNQADIDSVLKYVAWAIGHDSISSLANLVGSEGTAYARYGSEYTPPGVNNSDQIRQDLEQAFKPKAPQCLGYDRLTGSRPDKAVIYLASDQIDWPVLEIVPGSRHVVSFGFTQDVGDWTLAYIVEVPSSFVPDINTLLACPIP